MKLHEIAIFTDNVDAAARFYEQLLNAPPAHREEGLAIFETGGISILIHAKYQPSPEYPPCENHVAFAVGDVDQAVAELEQRGTTVEIPPRDYDWGRSAYLRDPDGHLLELYEKAS